MKRLCFMCGAVDVSSRCAQTMFCLDCGPKANRCNGSYEAHKAVAMAVRKRLFTAKQARFVRPNWAAFTKEANHV